MCRVQVVLFLSISDGEYPLHKLQKKCDDQQQHFFLDTLEHQLDNNDGKDDDGVLLSGGRVLPAFFY